MKICIAGMGKIGIPLAAQFATKGAQVVGYDINPPRVADINNGRNPLPAEPGVAEAFASGRIGATSDPAEAASGADVIIFIVPVDIDDERRPAFSALDAAVAALAPHVRRGSLVIVETTVPVGTTRNRVGPALERLSGLRAGEDILLAFSPERVSSGTVLLDLKRYPKIVGGIDAASTRRAAEFYTAMLDAPVLELRDAETAEFSKLAETTYRDVNIALANEFAHLADRLGVDLRAAIEAANSQPYSHIHAPGVGVGGHCIPVYPYFLANEATPLINDARRINDGMAAYGAERLEAALGTLGGATVVVLGLAYRAGVKESRHSSALPLAAALQERGATVYVHDPLYTDDEVRQHSLEPPPGFPLPCDALAIQAWHREYERLDFSAFAGLRAILDGRGVLGTPSLPEGVCVVGIGS